MRKFYFLVAGLLCLNLNLTAQQELIQNGSFELGEQGWDFSLTTNGFADAGDCLADDGDNYLWFGDYAELTGINNIDYEIVFQTVSLPANLDYAELTFSWSGTSDEQDDINEFDFLYFGLVDENGNEIISDSVSNADLDPSLTVSDCDEWYSDFFYEIDSQYAGQDIQVVFGVKTDDNSPTIFRIDNVSLVVLTTSGLFENNISQIQISPNPAAEQIQINNLNNSDSQISIFNSAGKEIYSHSLKSGINTIDISNLTPGFYFVKEQNGAVSKIVKQ